jgi:hypothetical protein
MIFQVDIRDSCGFKSNTLACDSPSVAHKLPRVPSLSYGVCKVKIAFVVTLQDIIYLFLLC